MNLKTGLIVLVVVVVLALAAFSAYKSFHKPGNVHPGQEGAGASTTETGGGAVIEKGAAQDKGGMHKMPGG